MELPIEIRRIMEILPHRYPLVLIDRILELEPMVRALGYKNVTANEPYFVGHFPGNPLVPGVYMVEALRKAGLARGGTLENAVVFTDDGPMQPLRFSDEPVRHKVLDLVGDFSLLGAWPQCEIVAIKGGHALHHRAVLELRDDLGNGAAAAR